jgi:hypothetical protein
MTRIILEYSGCGCGLNKSHSHTTYEYDKFNNVHRTNLKCIVNPILRAIQFWTNTPIVIVSNFNDYDKFIGYSINRMKLLN